MPDIPFPLSSAPGERPQEGAGRLINCFSERLNDVGRRKVRWRRSAGLSALTTLAGVTACRGMLEVNGTLFVAVKDKLFSVVRSGGAYIVTEVDDLPGSDRVTFARNGVTPVPDILVVTEQSIYTVTSSAVTDLNDSDLPQPTDVCSISAYFVAITSDGRAFVSGLNDTTFAALDVSTAESKPDGLTRCWNWRGRLLLIGSTSIEVWYNAGNPTGSPFSYETTISRGLLSKFAIAGAEDGWADALVWVGDDRKVYRLDGYTPVPISTSDVERAIEALGEDTDQLEALVYMAGGNAFWALSCDSWTWEYNFTTGEWNERQSYGAPRWRARMSAKAFGSWIVGDYQTDDLHHVTLSAQDEAGAPLVMRVESADGASFPSRIQFPRADFDFVVGQGEAPGTPPTETAPQVSISWSDDGGATWSTPLLRPLGPQGAYGTRVSVLRTGLTGPQGRRWRLDISDPVHVVLLGGSHAAIERAA